MRAAAHDALIDLMIECRDDHSIPRRNECPEFPK